MRKRTYCALDEPTSCVSKNLQDVTHTQKKKTFQTSGGVQESSKTQTQFASETPGSLLGFPKPDSLGNLDTNSVPEPNEDDIPVTTIHNLVGTCEIFSSVQPIDLDYVYHCLPNSYYNRQRFAAITIRVTAPVCTGLLFTSGKLVVTGSKSLIECNLAALKIVRALQRHIPFTSFTVKNAVIQNVVAHVVLPLKPGKRLNVDSLYEEKAANCTSQYIFNNLKLQTLCFT